MLEKRTHRTSTKLHDLGEEQKSDSVFAPIPRCVHGSALRFSRTDGDTGLTRDFYACSVSRDRKLCKLFYWVEDWDQKLKRGNSMTQLFPDDLSRSKKKRFEDNLGIETLVDNSSNAQFTFDRETISIINSICLHHADKTHSSRFLCIGAPSIHRELLRKGMKSVLLDEDTRLGCVSDAVYRFNMFTGEFLDSNPNLDDTFSVIICDPPFQPELLSALFKSIQKRFPVSFNSALILFAFPYFFKSKVIEACPRLSHMSDLRLTYSNHHKYKTACRSPVRLFISSPSLKAILQTVPSGYHTCDDCDEIVSDHNKHCGDCTTCTTISGKHAYKHCKDCGKCVKGTAVHCSSCKRCFISSHTCNS